MHGDEMNIEEYQMEKMIDDIAKGIDSGNIKFGDKLSMMHAGISPNLSLEESSPQFKELEITHNWREDIRALYEKWGKK